jgi:hypothetical protein
MSSLEPELSRLSTDEDKLPTVDLLLISFLPLFFMNMELIGEARLSQRLLWLLWFGLVMFSSLSVEHGPEILKDRVLALVGLVSQPLGHLITGERRIDRFPCLSHPPSSFPSFVLHFRRVARDKGRNSSEL